MNGRAPQKDIGNRGVRSGEARPDAPISAVPAPAPSRAGRRWANISLAAGGLWLVFSLLPTFVTTLLGLPLAAVALLAGRWARHHSRAAGDPAGARRAAWGLGLGCAGCAWQIVYYVLLFGAGATLLAGAASSVWQSFQGSSTP